MNWHRCLGFLIVVIATSLVGSASAELLLYEPFNYTAGESLGGTPDPDGEGPLLGTPFGQINANTGGGRWYAHGTGGVYDPANDTSIIAGNLTYAGLAASQGNSVSYGAQPGVDTNYTNSIALPQSISSGSVYASFIIRIKSGIDQPPPSSVAQRHSPAALITGTSDETTAGGNLNVQAGPTNSHIGATFFMRSDPAVVNVTNFSPGKSNADGIGPGAAGPSTGWQDSRGGTNHEANQFGDKDGQPAASLANPNSYQTYFVVLKYAFSPIVDPDPGNIPLNNDRVSLWMNPGSGTLGLPNGESLASQDPVGNLGSYYAAIDAFGTATTDVISELDESIRTFTLLGHRQTTVRSIAVDFDELRVGTTWADVTPAGPTFTPTGDFDDDGDADGKDFLTWQSNYGLSGASLTQGDADGNGTVNDADLAVWRSQFGQTGLATAAVSTVPEPATFVPAMLAAAGLGAARRRSRWHAVNAV